MAKRRNFKTIETGVEGMLARLEEWVEWGNERPSDKEVKRWCWLMTAGEGSKNRTHKGYGATQLQFWEALEVPTERAGETAKFIPRPKQLLILQRIHLAWEENRVWKGIILKTRRYGITTFFLLFAIERALRLAGWRGSTVAKDFDDALMFNSMVRQVVNQIPEWVRPQTVTAASGVYEWRHGQYKESAITIYTANKGGIGRGDRTNMLHPTEPPHYTDRAKEQYYGAQPSLGEFTGNIEAWESTAKGHDAMFHRQWEASHEIGEVGGNSEFERLFIAAYEHPDFYRPFRSEHERIKFSASVGRNQRFGGEQEKWYFDNLLMPYQLKSPWHDDHSSDAAALRALQQLNHARALTTDKCKGSVSIRKQEYPFTAEEAFISTGAPFFRIEWVMAWLPIVRKEHQTTPRGNFMVKDVSRVEWSENPQGLWSMRQDRENGVSYCFGGDTASGYEVHSDGQAEADFPTCVIAETLTGFICAELRAHIRPREHAYEVAKASLYYGKAKGYIERSVVGDLGAMMTTLTDLQIGDWMAAECLLKSVRMLWLDGAQIEEEIYGWQTKAGTKLPACEWAAGFFEDEVGPPIEGKRCELTFHMLDEMRFFDRRQSSTLGTTKRITLGSTRGHDDMVMSLVLMLQARRVLMIEPINMTKVDFAEQDPEVAQYQSMWESKLEVTRGRR